VAINYDRVMEDRTLINAGGRPGARFSLKPIFRYLRLLVWQKLTRQATRYGMAAVSFGEPLSLAAFMAEHDSEAELLGQELMARIGRVMPVVPFPVIAHAIGSGIRSQKALLPAIQARFEAALEAGAPVFLPKREFEYTIEATLKTLAGRKVLQMQNDDFTLTEEGEALIAFYARSVTPVLGDFEGVSAQ